MQVGILFYSDTIAMAKEARSIMGRAVANNGFMQALLQHAGDTGLTIYVTTDAEKEYFLEGYAPFLQNRRVRLVSLQEMPADLEQNPVDALHVLGPDLFRGLHIRNKIAQKPIPVTGVTHTLGHAPYLDWMLLNLMNAPQSYDRLICTTPTAEQVIHAFAKRVSPAIKTANGLQAVMPTAVIPLGITVNEFCQAQPNIRTQLGIPATATVLLSLSRFSYYTKGDLQPLLLMMRSLSLQHPQLDFRLVLAGATGNENYPELLDLVAQEYGVRDKILFVTNPDEATKRALYGNADVFVSLCDNPQETFGLTLLEAQAAGLPVICADWNGYKSLVVEGQTGYRIPTMNLPQNTKHTNLAPLQLDSLNHLFFSQAVAIDHTIAVTRFAELITAPAKRKAMGENARAHVARYDWSHVISDYLNLWRQLTVEARGKSFAQPNLQTMDYHVDFASYPTEQCQANMRFQISTLGQEALSGKVATRRYNAMDEVIDVPVMAAILRLCAQPVSVSELETQIGPKAPQANVAFHVLHLYKYGLLQRAGIGIS